MKRMVLVFALALVSIAISAQRDRLDDFFSRYSGAEGFTTVTINGDLFSLIAKFDNEDEDLNKMADKITSIRIISTEKEIPHPDVNFYVELRDEIRRGGYEEMMTVKDPDNDVLVLVRTSGETIRELLLIASGKNQTVIQIKGLLHERDLDSLSRSHIEGLEYLEELENSGK